MGRWLKDGERGRGGRRWEGCVAREEGERPGEIAGVELELIPSTGLGWLTYDASLRQGGAVWRHLVGVRGRWGRWVVGGLLTGLP